MAGRAKTQRLHRTARLSGIIALTCGDPAGIGPEILLKVLKQASRLPRASLVVIGHLTVFEVYAAWLKLTVPRWQVVRTLDDLPCGRGGLFFWDQPAAPHVTPGRSSAKMGAAAHQYLEAAMDIWRAGRLQALVTGPLTKWAVAETVPDFVGQTEWLAAATASRHVLMAFVADMFRVVVLTRHIPLGDVPKQLTRSLLRSSLRMLHQALRGQFGIPAPRIAVCGVNPHAGEAGQCGREEVRLMRPVLAALRAEGLRCDGPFAADGFFAGPYRQYDAIVCAYHDQGLIPFKMQARDTGCQVSLGLPFMRTSPDHGSALDIAGKGKADPGSLQYAMALAASLSARAC